MQWSEPIAIRGWLSMGSGGDLKGPLHLPQGFSGTLDQNQTKFVFDSLSWLLVRSP